MFPGKFHSTLNMVNNDGCTLFAGEIVMRIDSNNLIFNKNPEFTILPISWYKAPALTSNELPPIFAMAISERLAT